MLHRDHSFPGSRIETMCKFNAQYSRMLQMAVVTILLILYASLLPQSLCSQEASPDAKSRRKEHRSETAPKRVAPSDASSGKNKKSVTEKIDKSAHDISKVPAIAGNEIYQRLLKGSVFIACDVKEDWSSMAFGTGWVLDKERRIVVTNHHVVSEGLEVRPERIVHVYFPYFEKGELLIDRWRYAKERKPIRAEIVDTDPKRDLALLILDEIPDEAIALPLSSQPTRPGDQVHQLGNPGASDAMWVYTSGTVRQVYRTTAKYPEGLECDYLRVETQSPTNPGDSGGPVVNNAGEIVAINHASGGGILMTHFIDVRELKELLKFAEVWFAPKTAEQFNDRGVHYYEAERYDKAIQDFSRALQLDPKLADAASNRGWALVQKDDAQTALVDFDEAIKLNPRDPNYWEGRGTAHMSLGKPQAAVKDFTKAIQNAPHNAEHYNERADARLAAEDYKAAVQDYARAIELEPTNPDYFNSRGVTLAEQENYAAAIKDYTKAINLKEDPVYFYNRGIAHHNLKQYDDAALDFFRTSRLDPDYAESNMEEYDRKLIRIKNSTKETIKVLLKYHTETDGGETKWFPDPPGKETWATYQFAPGEESFVSHEDFKINADRVRMLVFSEDRSRVWDQFRNEDYVICNEPYKAFVMDVHTITVR